MEAPYISKLQVSKPWLAVFLVDGAWVRKNYNVDFVYGGHDLVYNFIPKREIWLDSSVEVKERPFTLLHELYERHRMDSLGETYDVAHEFAAALEKKYRKDQTGLHEKIKELFDMNNQTTKQAFSMPSDNVMRWAVMPTALGLVGGAAGRYAATPEEKARGMLEGAAVGAITGLGVGFGNAAGEKLFKSDVARYLSGLTGGAVGAYLGTTTFPGTISRGQEYQERKEAQDKRANFQKCAFNISNNMLRWVIAPAVGAAGGGAISVATAPRSEKDRALREGMGLGALAGLGFGAGHQIGSMAYGLFDMPRWVPWLTGASSATTVGLKAPIIFPGLRARTRAWRMKQEAEADKQWADTKKFFEKKAYWLGYKLAFDEVKEQPTRPTHKNPGPVASEPTSPITSTPKQDSTVTSIVSPKTY